MINNYQGPLDKKMAHNLRIGPPSRCGGQVQFISPRPLSLGLPSDPQSGIHPVRGDDVRLHHRPAGVAGGGDDLLLQEDRRGGRGGAEGERVSDAQHSARKSTHNNNKHTHTKKEQDPG